MLTFPWYITLFLVSMSAAPSLTTRRSSLASTPNPLSGRRASTAGITPNLAAPTVDPRYSRKGSLRDLQSHREAIIRASAEHGKDQQDTAKYRAVRFYNFI